SHVPSVLGAAPPRSAPRAALAPGRRLGPPRVGFVRPLNPPRFSHRSQQQRWQGRSPLSRASFFEAKFTIQRRRRTEPHPDAWNTFPPVEATKTSRPPSD